MNFFRGYIFEEEIVSVFMQLLSKISDYINVLDVIRYLNHACYDPKASIIVGKLMDLFFSTLI